MWTASPQYKMRALRATSRTPRWRAVAKEAVGPVVVGRLAWQFDGFDHDLRSQVQQGEALLWQQ
ncbi:MAG TPA: hypothetical protein VNK52_07735 [Hyphomicrobiaceae bacterium]|nr:hypothetical protein [Hyphomicrobiaceae bacterium]